MPFIPNTFEVEDLKKVILQDFPDMPITSAKLLNNGWDNVVLEINAQYIFRFPKDEGYRFAEEIKLLELLRGKITLAIPDPEFIGKSLVYMGYKKVEGGDMTEDIFNSLSDEQKDVLAFDLANFLAEFHRTTAIAKFVELNPVTEEMEIQIENPYENLESIISDKPTLYFISETIDEYKSILENKSEQVVLYNDLHTENMAFDPISKKLNGVFDFGDVT